jgi:hypothetical protein
MLTAAPDSTSNLAYAPLTTLYGPSYLRYRSVELMKSLTFQTARTDATTSRAVDLVEVGYGARFVGLPDEQNLSLEGGSVGSYAADWNVDNQTFGPELNGKWTRRRGRWQSSVTGALTLGYNQIDAAFYGQRGVFGATDPLALGGAYSSYSDELAENDFSPILELGLRLSYDLTTSSQVYLGYDVLQLGDMRLADDSVLWRSQNSTLMDRGGADLGLSTASVGISWQR